MRAGARPTRRWWLVVAGLVALLANPVSACSRGDDSPPRDDKPLTGGRGPHDPPRDPDVEQDLATAAGERRYLELAVDEVREDGDEIVVRVTITNVSDESQVVQGIDFVREHRAGMGYNRQIEGMYLIDWTTQTAYYPMSTDDGECRCSELESHEVPLRPDESLSLLAFYNGIDELEDWTLVLPGFLPADGSTAS